MLALGQGDPATAARSANLANSVAALLPVRHQYELGSVSLPNTKANQYGYAPVLAVSAPENSQGMTGFSLLAVDPAFMARFDEYGAKAAEALRAGKIVVPDTRLSPGQCSPGCWPG